MPSSIVHSYFACDMANKIDKSISKKLDVDYLKVFAQGPDIFYFYNLMIGKKAKKIKEIGEVMHNFNTQKYFLSLINYINDNNLYGNKEIMSYLYGAICHYVLDKDTHPYIIYYTGFYNKKDKNTIKYLGLHPKMEYYLDCYFIYEREKILPKDFKSYQYLVNIKGLSSSLKKMLDSVISIVYDIEKISPIYEKSIFDMKKFYHVFNYDKYGIKKVFYKMIDIVSPKKCIKKEILSFNVNPSDLEYYLNLDKQEWNHPMDEYEIYDYSFIEIYIKALNEVVEIITAVDNMLNNKKIDNNELLRLFPNYSYVSGKECNSTERMQYFKDNKRNILS